MGNPPPDDDRLFDLYKLHAEEIRFQLKLNWDRSQYFLVLNAAILSVAATIWKSDATQAGLGMLAALFIVGIFTATMARAAVKQGHRYYRRATLQRARVEYLLGLHDVHPADESESPFNLTLSSTSGSELANQMLGDPEAFVNREVAKRGQIGWYLNAFFVLLGILNVVGLVVSVSKLLAGKVVLPKLVLGRFDLGLFLTIAAGIALPVATALLVLGIVRARARARAKVPAKSQAAPKETAVLGGEPATSSVPALRRKAQTFTEIPLPPNRRHSRQRRKRGR